jgi:hypothetical protein
MLGWLSVGIAAAVFALVVGALVPGLPEIRIQPRSSGNGVGAVAGGVGPWLQYTLVMMIVAGVASAVLGMVRSERPRWVHVAGVSLNVIAPIAAVLTIRAFLAAVW